MDLRLINRQHNRTAGRYLGSFYQLALTVNHPYYSWFGVRVDNIPTTYWEDRQGLPRWIETGQEIPF
ncbi:hypothetical protein [Oscillatoria salina]|uniref:hypothetical protein n=1 Tax=Oscillatoria salina TaxID=331517 RepID=UPI001CCAB159|nr:hypothetical protein [Oscillatoria salina]MBZ8178552.1 hypothetical protein [Oscillatoria salina IIICB1]